MLNKKNNNYTKGTRSIPNYIWSFFVICFFILVIICMLSNRSHDKLLTNITSISTELNTTEDETTTKKVKEIAMTKKVKETTTKKVKEIAMTKKVANVASVKTTKAITKSANAKAESSSNTYYDVPLSKDLQSHIIKLSKKHNIDPKLVIAIIKKESTYKSSAMGDNGASYGLMQIQIKYHKSRMNKLGCTNLLDPYQNVKVGIDYLAELYSTGKGTKWVLMAYNGGPSAANRNMANGMTTNYAKTVLYYRDCIK